jgi:hypothetical protein
MRNYRKGIKTDMVTSKLKGVPTCEHKDRGVYSKGLCYNCYQNEYKKSKRDGSWKADYNHNKIPLWKIIKGIEEGKSGNQISKELGANQSSISRICAKYGLKTNFKFSNVKTYRKMCKNGKWNGRIISIPSCDIKSAGFDPKKEIYCKVDALKDGELKIQMFYEVPKGV